MVWCCLGLQYPWGCINLQYLSTLPLSPGREVRMSVTLEIWPEFWTLSGNGKSIPDYLPNVSDASAVLHTKTLEFQWIILRHTGQVGGRRVGYGYYLLTSSAAQSVQVWFVMTVNDIMMNNTIEFHCLSTRVCTTSDSQHRIGGMNY